MLQQIVRLTVNFTVLEGQLKAFQSIAAEMTEASKAEAGTLGYEWFAHADRKTIRLVETYADASAVEAHFAGRAVTELVPQIVTVCTVDQFEIY